MTVRLVCGIAVGVLVFSAAFVHAQDTASLTGTVRDPTGASIAGAQVMVGNAEHGINRTTVTNSDGEYSVPALPAPNSYDITVTAEGFKKYVAKGVVLDGGKWIGFHQRNVLEGRGVIDNFRTVLGKDGVKQGAISNVAEDGNERCPISEPS